VTAPTTNAPTETRYRGLGSPPDLVGRGLLLAVGAALISGLAIYLNSFAVKQVPDAAVYTTLKNGVAAALLVGVVLLGGGRRDLRAIDRRRWPAIVAVGMVGGSIPFILFFAGLSVASAPSAAFIQKTLFVWVALLAVPVLHERLGLAPIAALATLFVGQSFVLPPDGIRWGTGETLILAATLLWGVETVLVKGLLVEVPAGTMAALRMGIGFVVLVAYLGITGRLPIVAGLAPLQWGWVVVTGSVLAGYVTTWFGALRSAPASVVTSVLVLGAVVTGLLTSATKGTVPDAGVVAGYILIVAAAAALAAWTITATRRPAVVFAGPPDAVAPGAR
jgi:drug/metabolite transporter (DMT)-like permease